MFQLNMISSLLVFLEEKKHTKILPYLILKMFPEAAFLSSLSQSLKRQVRMDFVCYI